MFSAVSVDLKRKGLVKVDHTESIEPEDLKKLYTSLTLSPDTSEGLLHKCWFDVMFFLCRRGRENLREMKKDTFKFAKDSNERMYLYQARDELAHMTVIQRPACMKYQVNRIHVNVPI
jgi:hypothetical protein